MGSTPIRLLIVNRHALMRAALAGLFEGSSSVQVIGHAGTRAQALAEAACHTPDVVLLEPHQESQLWLDAVAPIVAAAGGRARVLLLAGDTDGSFHRQAFRGGAHGILSPCHPPETLLRAVEKVHDGEVWLDRRLVAELMAAAPGSDGTPHARMELLTKRERDVVRLVSEGLKNKQIAERLSVADVTVRHHLTSIFAKLNVADRLSLVVFAYRSGMTGPPATSQKPA